jgi:hypothetical protein
MFEFFYGVMLHIEWKCYAIGGCNGYYMPNANDENSAGEPN